MHTPSGVTMGISVEFNPELALRNIREFRDRNREKEECIPEMLEVGKVFGFLKRGQRNYWLHGEVPLIETRGNGVVSRPRASVIILETIHFIRDKEPFTRGRYKVVQVFSGDKVEFEGTDRVGSRY